MANKYKYVCTVSALFRAARAFVRGPAQRISCMSGTRYRSPDSRPSAGVSRARGRAGCWRIRKGGVSRSAENPGRVSVCPAAGEGSRMPIRVSAGPKAGERMNAGTPSACLPACREMRGPVTRTAPSVCRKGVLVVGTGALPCLLPAKNEGSPERLPSPSKINP